jgi:hypothetical protein
MASDKKFLTSEELADRHRKTHKGVLQDHYRGVGPRAHKIGRRLLFAIEDVEAWEATRVDEPAAS